MVDVFIVGEPKSGTTALASFLSDHPSIALSNPKEPHYFATDSIRESDEFHGGKKRHFEIRTKAEYDSCFSHAKAKQLKIDASTHYLVSKEAAKNIREYNPEAKIIILLREPVVFLQSLHQQYVNNGSEDETNFETAFNLQQERKEGNRIPSNTRCPSHLQYSERIRYLDHIERFYAQFPDKNILVLLHEDFKQNNAATYQQVLDFLNLNTPTDQPEFTQVHGAKAPRNAAIHGLLNHPIFKQTLRRLLSPQAYDTLKHRSTSLFFKAAKKAALDPAFKARLHELAQPEVMKLDRRLKHLNIAKKWGYDTQS